MVTLLLVSIHLGDLSIELHHCLRLVLGLDDVGLDVVREVLLTRLLVVKDHGAERLLRLILQLLTGERATRLLAHVVIVVLDEVRDRLGQLHMVHDPLVRVEG